MKDYVVKTENGAYRIADSRVSLDSVVYAYQKGDLPELIARKFPVLTLPQIYGAIAYYLENQTEIDRYLRQNEAEFERQRQAQRLADPEFYARLAKAKQKLRKTVLANK